MEHDTKALATEALSHEGIHAYFPGVADEVLDGFAFDELVNILAAWLEANPDRWEPAGEDCGWTCDLDHDDLAALALAEVRSAL